MSSQPLLQSNPTAAKSYVQQKMSPLKRYNIFVDCYNMPTNIIQDKKLEHIQDPSLYNFIFESLAMTRGKIAFVFLCILPFINIFVFLFSIYFAAVYFKSLNIHQKNKELVNDPFKKMTFDPQMCYTMNCDYYFFNIELKELDGFSLNYRETMSHRLTLRKERGKTSLMIYNANFWAHYNHFTDWKTTHLVPIVISFLFSVASNFVLFYFIFR